MGDIPSKGRKMTDPSKFCKDIDIYEGALKEAVQEMSDLFKSGHCSWIGHGALWNILLAGMYGRDAFVADSVKDKE